MQHAIPHQQLAEKVGDHAASGMARAVHACVHCGFCLATCPTYVVLGEEAQSPRGRILLIKELLEGGLELEEVLPSVDPCLGCLACETSCPSGVAYRELITPFRALTERERDGWWRRLRRRTLLRVLMSARLASLAFRLGKVARFILRPVLPFLPVLLRAPLDLLPGPSSARRRRETFGAVAEPPDAHESVAVLRGCVQTAAAPEVHRATVAVLERAGVRVVVREAAACCGSLALHAGEEDLAREAARSSMYTFDELLTSGDVDAVVTDAAGCGSGMAEWPALFAAGRGDASSGEVQVAERVAAATQDVTEFLLGVVPRPALSLVTPTRVAYQDACHLLHAQGVNAAPRLLLEEIENLELVEPQSPEVCCGSAGIYNLDQPEVARELGDRKAEALLATGAEVIATANVGCLMQLRAALARLAPEKSRPQVLHISEILDRAAREGVLS